MYSRKSVRPRMEPSGTPALTRYSSEPFPSRTTLDCLLLRKEKRPNIWPKIRKGLWRRTACQTLSKTLAVLSDTTARRSAVNEEDLKPYWKSEKRPYFSRRPTILLFTIFDKEFTNHRGLIALSQTFLNTGTTDETLQQSGNQDSLRYLLMSSASM